jgi:hypothetical protein
VAVIGSVYASLYGSRLTATLPAGLPARISGIAHQSLGAAYAVSGQVPGALGQALRTAATNAFLHGLSIGCLVAGGVAAAEAVLAVMFLPAHPVSPSVATPAGTVPVRTLRPDVVREAFDAAGDRPAVAGLGDAVVEVGEDTGVARHEGTEAHREHDADNQRQDAAHDPRDGRSGVRPALGRSAADGDDPEDGCDEAAEQAQGEQDEGDGGHQAGYAEDQGGNAEAVPRPGRRWRGQRLC